MLRTICHCFIAATVVFCVVTYIRGTLLQSTGSTESSQLRTLLPHQPYSNTSDFTLWTDLVRTFNQTHPLLNSTSPESLVLLERGVPQTTRLECVALYAMKTYIRSICVVGNGPLTDTQRMQISACDIIMRFNQMNTRRCGERVDVWVVRYAGHVPLGYHGLNNTVKCGAGEALAAARSIWFLDGAYGSRVGDVGKVLRKQPELVKRLWVPLDTRPLRADYKTSVDRSSMPSTGWLGMMMALQCAPEAARVHLFGFNWSIRHWQAHRMASEEVFARALHKAGRIFIHWPVCDGLRNCNHCLVAMAAGRNMPGCAGGGRQVGANIFG